MSVIALLLASSSLALTLSLATGVMLRDENSVKTMLERISRFNDGAQAWLFDPNDLAPEAPRNLTVAAGEYDLGKPAEDTCDCGMDGETDVMIEAEHDR